MKPDVSVRSGMKLLLAALCLAAVIHTSASQSNTTSGVYSTATPVPTSGRNNTNSSNTMLPPGFTATADPMPVTKPVTMAVTRPVTGAPIEARNNQSSEESSEDDEKEKRGKGKKRRNRQRDRKRERD